MKIDTEKLKKIMKRCDAEAIDSAIRFHDLGLKADLEKAIVGCFRRFADKGKTVDRNSRVKDDLGMGGITRMEVIILIEDILGIKTKGADLEGLQTIGDFSLKFEDKLAERGQQLDQVAGNDIDQQSKQLGTSDSKIKDGAHKVSQSSEAWGEKETAALKRYAIHGIWEDLLHALPAMVKEAVGKDAKDKCLTALKTVEKCENLVFEKAGISVGNLNDLIAKYIEVEPISFWNRPSSGKNIVSLIELLHEKKSEILAEAKSTEVAFDKFKNSVSIKSRFPCAGIYFNYIKDLSSGSAKWAILLHSEDEEPVLTGSGKVEFISDNDRFSWEYTRISCKLESSTDYHTTRNLFARSYNRALFKQFGPSMASDLLWKAPKTTRTQIWKEYAAAQTDKETLIRIAEAKTIAVRIAGSELGDQTCKELQVFVRGFVGEVCGYDLSGLQNQ